MPIGLSSLSGAHMTLFPESSAPEEAEVRGHRRRRWRIIPEETCRN